MLSRHFIAILHCNSIAVLADHCYQTHNSIMFRQSIADSSQHYVVQAIDWYLTHKSILLSSQSIATWHITALCCPGNPLVPDTVTTLLSRQFVAIGHCNSIVVQPHHCYLTGNNCVKVFFFLLQGESEEWATTAWSWCEYRAVECKRGSEPQAYSSHSDGHPTREQRRPASWTTESFAKVRPYQLP